MMLFSSFGTEADRQFGWPVGQVDGRTVEGRFALKIAPVSGGPPLQQAEGVRSCHSLPVQGAPGPARWQAAVCWLAEPPSVF